MNTPDLINSAFEAFGSVMIWLNVWRLYIDKETKGVSVGPTAFFVFWGFYNLFFYPHLHQWLSFAGGCSLVIANTFWLGLMLHYRKKATT